MGDLCESGGRFQQVLKMDGWQRDLNSFFCYHLQYGCQVSVVENLLSWADFKRSKDLKRTDRTKRHRITGITKLKDANDAGGRNSEKCTLVLTEGDSAKALALSTVVQ